MRIVSRAMIILMAWAGIVASVLQGVPCHATAAGWSAVQNLTPRLVAGKREARDPAVYVEPNGVVHIAYREKGIYYLRSDDKGRTWSAPVLASGARTINGAPTLVADRDGVHVVWPSLEITPAHTHYQLFYVRSEDRGETWTLPEMLTESESHSSDPALLRHGTGITLMWFELDEKSLPFRPSLTTDILSSFYDNPLQGVVPTEFEQIRRSTILIAQSTSGGRQWSRPSLVAEVLNPLEIFAPYQISDNSFGVYWSERRKIYNRVTPDGGTTWEFQWQLDRHLDSFFLNQIVHAENGVHLIGVPRKPFEMLRIRHLDVNRNQETLITQPAHFRSPPKAVFGAGEIHIVWSLSDDIHSWVAYQRTDKTPPQTRIVDPADPNITEHTFRIAWEGEDDISQNLTYSRLRAFGGDEWTPFEPGQFLTIQTPPDGEYVFKVRAKDEAGNVEPTPAELTFNTFGVPPNTIFEQPPPSVVNARSIQVTWSGYDNTVTDPSDLLYSYQLNDEGWSEFRKIRQQTFRGLTEGHHVLRVRSMDNRELIDPEPAEAAFEVVLGIQSAFTTTPPPAMNQPRIQFAWGASDKTGEEVAFLYSHRLNNGPWSEWSISDSYNLENLEEGRHVFEVRTRDEIGNLSPNNLIHEFAIDLTPPKTVADLVIVQKDNDYLPLISLGGTDNVTAQDRLQFEYRLGEGAWQDVKVDEGRTLLLASSLSPWSPGFVVEIRAKDEVGNIDPNPVVLDLRFPGRYLHYSMLTLGVSILYPIVFGLVALLIIVGLAGIVITMVKRRRAPVPAVEDDAFGTSTSESSFGDDEDLFGGSSPSSSSSDTEIKFDDDDDLFR